MILEIAILNIQPGQAADFEAAFARAQTGMDGYVSHQLQQCSNIPIVMPC